MPRTESTLKPVFFEESPHRRERKETRVGQIQDSAFTVVELTEKQHEARYDETDVAGTYDYPDVTSRRSYLA